MPIDAGNADAAPDLWIEVATRDERSNLLCLSADHEVLRDDVSLDFLGVLSSSELDFSVLFDISDKARLNFLAERDDGVEARLAPSVENVTMCVSDKGKFLGDLAVG